MTLWGFRFRFYGWCCLTTALAVVKPWGTMVTNWLLGEPSSPNLQLGICWLLFVFSIALVIAAYNAFQWSIHYDRKNN